MRNAACRSIAVLLVFVATSLAALAEKRVALVIGNATYKNVERLKNPANDASRLADKLEGIGFDKVTLKLDLTGDGLRRELGRFSRVAAGADIALIYFAGHGIEVDGTNYVIPTDARLSHIDDVDLETIRLGTLMRALNRASKLKLVVLDACRNNPFRVNMSSAGGNRSIGRGLARVSPSGSDTLVAYAAREGTVAADGEGTHSPYAEALLKHISTPGLDVRLMFGRIRDDVLKSTGGKQEPFTYGSLSGETLALVNGKSKTAPDKPAELQTLRDELRDLKKQLLQKDKTTQQIDELKRTLEAQNKALRELRKQRRQTARLQQGASTQAQSSSSSAISTPSPSLQQRRDPPLPGGVKPNDYISCLMPGAATPVTIRAFVCTRRGGRVAGRFGGSTSSSSPANKPVPNNDRYVSCIMPGATSPVTVRSIICNQRGGRITGSNGSSVNSTLRRGVIPTGVSRNDYVTCRMPGTSSDVTVKALICAERRGRFVSTGTRVASRGTSGKTSNELLREGLAADKRQQYRKAMSLWRRAAAKGNRTAMWNIGILYYNGNGLRRNFKEAAHWIARGMTGRPDFAKEFTASKAKTWNNSFRQNLQRELRNRGLYSGAIDGSFGPATRRAVERLAGR